MQSMQHLFLLLFFILYGYHTFAHMIMEVPSNGGVNSEPAKELCKGAKLEKHPTALIAGSSFDVKLAGTATHDGGGCQFGLSYDNGKTFTVIMTTDDQCPIVKTYSVPIPANAPSCSNCVFAWGWIPKSSGAEEYYMNCAKVEIEGAGKRGKLSGPKMQFFNMPGYPSVHADGGNGAYTNGLTFRFGESTGTTKRGNRVSKEDKNDGDGVTSRDTPSDSTGSSRRLKGSKGREVENEKDNVGVTNVRSEEGSKDSDSKSGSGTSSAVYGDIRGASAEELLERAIAYQKRVAVEHRKNELRLLKAQQEK
jgi:hypothetical protein